MEESEEEAGEQGSRGEVPVSFSLPLCPSASHAQSPIPNLVQTSLQQFHLLAE
ncbi:hypothetical protein [Nostoc sp.]|uniref:hypothetical protein n=1 Tax=Nostoc sp. TaxID=1180 RepID=UPI002FFA3809